ncbi:MAG: galactokinase [Clostridium sp.]|nr:galactokinase [Clostridium sp.]
MKASELILKLKSGELDDKLKAVYVHDSAVQQQKPRYIKTAEKFIELFGDDREVMVLSAPGRTEICGNHTDHNNGKVLAASINLDAIAIAAKNDSKVVNEKSEGHSINKVDISNLLPDTECFGKSSAMIKGVIARLDELGYSIGGFDACTTSDVMGGSGLSSSAAFEVLIGNIISHLYNDGAIDAVEIAKAAQYSENVFFGKPSGLLDQMASSVGTFVNIDFENTDSPVIRKIDFDFASSGYSLCIVDTHGNHSDLTDDYAAVRGEMEAVAKAMGKSVLREIEFDDFKKAIPQLTNQVNDRALLRAMHFYNENNRVDTAVNALESGDFDCFLNQITESGMSSFMYNQNVFTPANPTEQKLSLALCIADELLPKGYRVHGGGFAGTIQAFVKNDMLDEFKSTMDAVFGEGSCHVLIIRPVGGARVI